MVNGVHAIVYAQDAGKARAFFKDVLGLHSVDAGRGWLIFALPPAEIAAHPAEWEQNGRQELYLMCDDVEKTVAELKAKGVEFADAPVDRGWGILCTLKVPGGGTMGLYQPKHPIAARSK
jgi:catechol 2,3-dioxygenase-like lactoylglutathione lyase family enzyme